MKWSTFGFLAVFFMFGVAYWLRASGDALWIIALLIGIAIAGKLASVALHKIRLDRTLWMGSRERKVL